VFCVNGVRLLVVLVAFGKRVSRTVVTVITRDSRTRGKGGLFVCVLSVVIVFP